MASVYAESIDELDDPLRQEVEFGGGLGRGDRGPAVRRTQEWLALHLCPVVIDGEFDLATERALGGFQRAAGLDPTGTLDFDTWTSLTRDMRTVLRHQPLTGATLREGALHYARRHLRARPRDVGGPDRGPWARLYLRGSDGESRPWRTRFASFVLRQAAECLEGPQPIVRSVTPDVLVARTAPAEVFVPGALAALDRSATERLLWYVGHVASGGAPDGAVWVGV